jgi:uncharacterized coiled-coil protein SlyX
VDTAPFDHSVQSLKGHVDLLTGSVVATEAAHVAERTEQAQKVADCMKSGFSKLILSELSQQTTELRNRTESALLKLRDLMAACLRVQETMQADYARITGRYAKVFESLDDETQKRVSSLDGDAITLQRQIIELPGRTSSQLCTEATISAAEGSAAQIKLRAGNIRAKAHELLQNAASYLAQERQLTRDMQVILEDVAVNESKMLCLEALHLEADSPNGGIQQSLLANDVLSPVQKKQSEIAEYFHRNDLPWRPMADKTRGQIERFLMPLVDGIQSGNQQHDLRVRRQMIKLWQSDSPQELSS